MTTAPTTTSHCEENCNGTGASTRTTGSQTEFVEPGTFDLQHGSHMRGADRRDKDGALDRPVGDMRAGESTSMKSRTSPSTTVTEKGTATVTGNSSRTITTRSEAQTKTGWIMQDPAHARVLGKRDRAADAQKAKLRSSRKRKRSPWKEGKSKLKTGRSFIGRVGVRGWTVKGKVRFYFFVVIAFDENLTKKSHKPFMAFYPKQYGEEPDSEQMTLGQVKQCCMDYEMMDKRADVPAATRELLRPLQKVAQQDRYKKYTMKMWQEVVGGKRDVNK